MELISGDSLPSDAFRLVTVCTANICRSPAMASVLLNGVEGRPGLLDSGIHLTSAGVAAAPGIAIDSRTAEALERAGFPVPGTVSTQLQPEQIASADLILTASRRHRAKIVRTLPQAREWTFTMREFARYCELVSADTLQGDHDPAARLRTALAQAQEMRGFAVPARPEDDDLADPIDGAPRVHRKMVRLIAASADSILAVTAGATGPQRAPSKSTEGSSGWGTLVELSRSLSPR